MPVDTVERRPVSPHQRHGVPVRRHVEVDHVEALGRQAPLRLGRKRVAPQPRVLLVPVHFDGVVPSFLPVPLRLRERVACGEEKAAPVREPGEPFHGGGVVGDDLCLAAIDGDQVDLCRRVRRRTAARKKGDGAPIGRPPG